MLNQPKRFAQVKDGSAARAVSQIFVACTSLFDWRQNFTSHSSRKYQPLATMPCSLGTFPVKNVACAVHVTAGTTSLMVAICPRADHALTAVMESPIRSGVRPTTLMAVVLRITDPAPIDTRARSNSADRA